MNISPVILVFLDWAVTALRVSPGDEPGDTSDRRPHSSMNSIFTTEDSKDAAECETWISSIGGSGTTSFMVEAWHVQPPLAINRINGRDGLKHSPFDKVDVHSLKKLKRIVYLHGDITHAILSLDRRGYMWRQAKRVHSTGDLKRMTLEEYARTPGDDFFQVDKHFHSFKDQCKYDVAFLDITKKTDHISELASFLEVPNSQLQDVFKPWHFSAQIENLLIKEKDHSNYSEADYVQELMDFEYNNIHMMGKNTPEWQNHYTDVPAWVLEALQKKFANVTAEMRKLGGLHIQKATCAGS